MTSDCRSAQLPMVEQNVSASNKQYCDGNWNLNNKIGRTTGSEIFLATSQMIGYHRISIAEMDD